MYTEHGQIKYRTINSNNMQFHFRVCHNQFFSIKQMDSRTTTKCKTKVKEIVFFLMCAHCLRTNGMHVKK